MKIFKIYSLIIVLFFSLSLFNIVHARCNFIDVLDKGVLNGKDLTGCDLQYANLEGDNLEGADLYRANLEGATWVDGRTCAKKSIGECL